MKLVYKDDQVRLLDQDKCRTLSVDVRGDVDLDAIEDLRRLLGKAEMLMRECPELEPCPRCGSKEVSVRVLGLFFDVACDCGMHGVYGSTAAEAMQFWNIESRELRERRKKR